MGETVSRRSEGGPLLPYNPRLSALIERADREWGTPQQNREGLVPYPSKVLSNALYGIDLANGEIIGIVAAKKTRKTTFALNILYHIYSGALPKVKPASVIFTLESGQRPGRVRDVFLSMKATELLANKLFGPPQDNDLWLSRVLESPELCLSPEFLRYNTRTPEQMRAIAEAKEVCSHWDIYIYGAGREEGNSRNLKDALSLVEKHAREGAKIFLFDHVQQFVVPGASTPFEQLHAVVNQITAAVVSLGVVGIIISQVSLTSLRDARQGLGPVVAMGGMKLSEEANVVFGTEYDGGNSMIISILDSRRSDLFSVTQALDKESGLFLGEARRNGK